MEGWNPELGPWKPVLQDNKLYGRGGADDGYAAFAAVTAINALQNQNIPHARCVIIIEACEESGSYDLPFYIDYLNDRIGLPSLVVCLDSGCGNYEQLWSTTSLRGVVGGTLSVDILTEGLHSGAFSGIAASSFRIIRELLSRVEDPKTGTILLPELYVDVPTQRLEQTKQTAAILGKTIYTEVPFVEGAKPISEDLTELLLNRTWRPTLSVIGVGGIPSIADAGNVLRPRTALKLSFRIPPTADTERATQAIKKVFEKDPPYHAKVKYDGYEAGSGWNAPETSEWLLAACDEASNTYFGKPCAYMGEGGSIPFMAMLGEKFPKAQFLITGVLGPHSNAHGPNEFLHLGMAKKVTACVAQVIAKHLN
jgi:acetylornithine deacetylase/succinyl-diaminopimelate desuccinylase-like protein